MALANVQALSGSKGSGPVLPMAVGVGVGERTGVGVWVDVRVLVGVDTRTCKRRGRRRVWSGCAGSVGVTVGVGLGVTVGVRVGVAVGVELGMTVGVGEALVAHPTMHISYDCPMGRDNRSVACWRYRDPKSRSSQFGPQSQTYVPPLGPSHHAYINLSSGPILVDQVWSPQSIDPK